MKLRNDRRRDFVLEHRSNVIYHVNVHFGQPLLPSILNTEPAIFNPELAQREFYVISCSVSNQIYHLGLRCYDYTRVSGAKIDVLG